MTQVTTHYRVITTAGHHRQPRNGPSWVEPGPTIANTNAVPGSQGSAYASASLQYPAGSQTVANFLFWSAGDGTNGQTSTDQTLTYTVGEASLTLVAWYLPPGGGVDGDGYVTDAFSDAMNDFVDDDFVSVSPDSALTSDANVVGWVPTKNGETLTAVPATIHTGETFEAWIGGHPLPSTATDQLGERESGYAVATYHRESVSVPPSVNWHGALGWLILFGIINDGPGLQIHLGGGGGGPVGPWGPYVQRVSRAAMVASLSASMAGSDEIADFAMKEAQAATEQLKAAVAAGARKGLQHG